MRSLLFVPGDRPDRFGKAVESGADAVILDLEDSVSLPQKEAARQFVRDWLTRPRTVPVMVRINPIDGDSTAADLDAISGTPPDAILLPKADGARSVRRLVDLAGTNCPPILPIAGETAAAVFKIGEFRDVCDRLIGLTWGAEDLSVAVGASISREDNGYFTNPYETVRSLTLFGAHAARVAPIDTVFPAIDDPVGLTLYTARARRDGFTGMLAIHPRQVPIINAGFGASEAELAQARAIIRCFADYDGLGALQFQGAMIDRPHLDRANALIASVERERASQFD